MSSVYLDVYIGDQEAHAPAKKPHDKVLALLDRHGSVYGLPSRPEDLSAEQRDIVQDMHVISLQVLSPHEFLTLYWTLRKTEPYLFYTMPHSLSWLVA